MGYDPWQPFVEQIAKQRRVIAPSHPGFGKSGLPEWLDSVDDIAYLHLELLDRLGVEQADMVACSVGGWIGAEMASKAPQRFRKLALIGPVGIKLGSPDRLDIPDVFAMPQAVSGKAGLQEIPARVLPKRDFPKLPDDELASDLSRPRRRWHSWSGSHGCTNTKLKRSRLHRIDAPGVICARRQRRARLGELSRQLCEVAAERTDDDDFRRRPSAAS